jgi:hypothetical protein
LAFSFGRFNLRVSFNVHVSGALKKLNRKNMTISKKKFGFRVL